MFLKMGELVIYVIWTQVPHWKPIIPSTPLPATIIIQGWLLWLQSNDHKPCSVLLAGNLRPTLVFLATNNPS